MTYKYDLSTNVGLDKKSLQIKVQQRSDPQQPSEVYGFTQALNEYRDHIDNIKTDDWKKVRWYINEYDFLVKDPIINRAFYKYWEIINEFELFDTYEDKHLVLHCAEAPGGFIQGTNIYLQLDRLVELKLNVDKVVDDDGFIAVQKKKRKPKYEHRVYTISLNKDLPQYRAYNLPSYNKNIINKHVCITYGKDNTGDINNWDNITHIKNISNSEFYLVTADGGFDEGTDFNNKEQLHYYLILSEIFAALELQLHGGQFILKVFDIFTDTSVQLLYLLSLCYEEVYIYKPKTSRPTNSEKYIVCKKFRLDDESRKYVTDTLRQLHSSLKNHLSKFTSFSLFNTIPDEFIDKVRFMNHSLITKQCNFLEKAVELCKDGNFLQKYEEHLQMSIEKRKLVFQEWERHYNLNSYV